MLNENNRQVKKKTATESKCQIPLLPVSDRYKQYMFTKSNLRGTGGQQVFPSKKETGHRVLVHDMDNDGQMSAISEIN